MIDGTMVEVEAEKCCQWSGVKEAGHTQRVSLW